MKQQNLFLMVDTLSKVAPQYFKFLETPTVPVHVGGDLSHCPSSLHVIIPSPTRS